METYANGMDVRNNYSNNVYQNSNNLNNDIKKEEIKTNSNNLNSTEEKNDKKISDKDLQKLTQKLNKEMEKLNPDIEFHFNDKIDRFVINVIDKNTDKVIRKIPSEEAINIMEKMKELTGALFDEKG